MYILHYCKPCSLIYPYSSAFRTPSVPHHSIKPVTSSRKFINIGATYFTHADGTLGAHHLARVDFKYTPERRVNQHPPVHMLKQMGPVRARGIWRSVNPITAALTYGNVQRGFGRPARATVVTPSHVLG